MAAGHVSKDSWARCDSPSMLYDATIRPGIPKQTPKVTVNSTDTLNAKVRLKKEIVDKLENKGLELSHESYVAVVQVGKYMFMAIMLPVYFCCYGMPRWFLINALPQLFMILKKQSLTIGKMIADMKKRVTDLMKGMIEQLIGDALKLTKDYAKSFKNYFKRHLEKVFNPFKNLLKTVAETREKAKTQAAIKSAKLYRRAEESVQQMNKRIAEKGLETLHRIQETAINLLHSFDRSILTPFINFISPPFVFTAGVIRSVKAGVNKMKAKIKQQIRKMTDPVVSRIKKAAAAVANEITKRIEKAIEPLQNWMIEKKEVLEVYWQTVHQIVVNPLIQVGMAMQARFNFLSKKGFQLVKRSIPKSLFKFARNIIPEGFKRKMKEQKQSLLDFGQAFRRVAAGVCSGCIDIVLLGVNLAKKIGNRVLAFIEFWKRVYRLISQQLRAIPAKLLKYSRSLLKGLVLVAGRVVFAFQVLLALLMIAFLDGLEELQSDKGT